MSRSYALPAADFPFLRSEAQAANPSLVPAEMVGKLVTQGPLDLAGKQLAVVAKVSFQGVSEDDDPVLVAVTRNTVAGILTVRMRFGPSIGNDHGNARQYLLKFVGQPIDCIDDQRLELIKVRRTGHTINGRASMVSPSSPRRTELRRRCLEVLVHDAMAMPSPTAATTRFTGPRRTSPQAKMPGTLVSSLRIRSNEDERPPDSS